MKAKPTLILLLFSCALWGQNDTLNKTNAKGNKNGFWKIYLTDHLYFTKDTTKACYYAYRYYDDGICVMDPAISPEGKKKDKIEHNGITAEKGNPIILNASFKFYSKKGLDMEQVYKDGFPLKYITWDISITGKLFEKEIVDFQNKYKGQNGSCSFDYYDNDCKYTGRQWWRKGDKGEWSFYKDK